jgi:hypothetical protein
MEDSPKLSGWAIVSLASGLIALFVLPINLAFRHATVAFLTSIPMAPIALLAIATGLQATRRIRKSEGSQRGYRIALMGVALGVTAPTLVIVWFFIMLGSCETSFC